MEKRRIVIPILIYITVIVITIITLYYNVDRFSYKYDSNYDGYIITRVYGNKENYIVDEKYKGKDIIGVGERAFYNKNLKSITFKKKENLKYIKRLAFSKCDKLQMINLEYCVEIERNAFSYCNNLNNIVCGAKYIGSSVFYKCNNLNNLTLNNTISLGSLALSHTSIKQIELPQSLNDLGVDAFKYTNTLESIIYHNIELKDNSYIKSLSIAQYIE